MQRLILVRHADAAPKAPSQGDAERPLTPGGRRDATLLGKALATAGWTPDRAFVSDAVRTRQTWEAMAAAFPGVEAEFRPEIYNAPPEKIAACLAKAVPGTVIVVGHNPGVALYAAHLATQSGAQAGKAVGGALPTATAVAFDMDGGRPRFARMFAAKDGGAQG